MSYIQVVTGRFSKNLNNGQSCCPSIDLMTVLKMKIRQGFLKKLLPKEVIHPTIHNALFSDSI